MIGIKLLIPQAPRNWIEIYDPFFFQRLEHKNEKEQQKLWEELNLLYENEVCNNCNPLYSRICTLCKLEFVTPNQAHKHFAGYQHRLTRAKIRGLPLPANPKECKVCELIFASVKNLTKHLKSKTHKDKVLQPQFHCDTCNADFKNKKQLNKHKRSNKRHMELSSLCPVIDKTYFCDLCNKSFKNSRQLNKHKRTNKTHKKLAAKTDLKLKINAKKTLIL